MLLAALIFGATEDDSTTAKVGLSLTIAAQTVVEYQMRCALALGAKHIILYSERVPAALLSIIDRISRNGCKVDLVCKGADVGDLVHPDEHLLIFSSGVAALPEVVQSALDYAQEWLMTLPNDPQTQRFERIDATTRWAGLAVLSGGLLRTTTAELGDWELEATLLRRAVQKGVANCPVSSECVESGSLTSFNTAADAMAFNRANVRSYFQKEERSQGVLMQLPLAEKWIAVVLSRRLSPELLLLFVVICGLSVLACAVAGWSLATVSIYLLACLGMFFANIVFVTGLFPQRNLKRVVNAHEIVGGVSLLLLFRHIAVLTGSYIGLVLAVWSVVEMYRLSLFRRRGIISFPLPFLRPTPAFFAVIMLLSIFLGYLTVGLASVTVYASVLGLLLSRKAFLYDR